jgi:hypothetical protein
MNDWFEQNRSRSLNVDDIMHTRITGQHQRWPGDPDTTARLKQLHHVLPPRFSLKFQALVIALLIGAVYGLWLLWSSL